MFNRTISEFIAPRRQERKEKISYLSELCGLCVFARVIVFPIP
jgi:hypothetical protein